MSFYTIVIIIAACFLILCLVAVGILMQSNNAATNFPPVQNPCPDGWTVNGDSCLIPNEENNTNKGYISNNISAFINKTYGLSSTNVAVTGNTKITTPLDGYTSVNFNHKDWNKGESILCSKKKWANQFGIIWDGISNNTGC